MIKKDITFIYMDYAEKAIMENIAKEAKKRGYKTRLTRNKFAKCEIGFYCQHTNFPQYSKYSVIMLHDIIQQYSNWPDIWMREPWNKYDIGILPSKQWVDNWNQCSQWYYTRPKKAMFEMGWPKSDSVANIDIKKYKEIFYSKYNLDVKKKTILYAPAWENDHKQDDFVQAMLKLDVNILIKQCPFTPEINRSQYENIQEMYKLHKDNPRVTILDYKMNIFEAIMASDVLVSEESSTMAEAIMMGIPAVSVSDWLIPDVTPSRYPACNYDFVIMTKKNELSDCVKKIIENYEQAKIEAEKSRDNTFGKIGKSSSMIMDIIDDWVNGEKFRYKPLKPKRKERLTFKNYIKHITIILHREIAMNYAFRYKIVGIMWNMAKKIGKKIIKSPIS